MHSSASIADRNEGRPAGCQVPQGRLAPAHQPEGEPVGPHGHVGGHEPAPAGRADGSGRPAASRPAGCGRSPAGSQPAAAAQLVGHRHPDRPAAGVAHRPEVTSPSAPSVSIGGSARRSGSDPGDGSGARSSRARASSSPSTTSRPVHRRRAAAGRPPTPRGRRGRGGGGDEGHGRGRRLPGHRHLGQHAVRGRRRSSSPPARARAGSRCDGAGTA